VGNSASVRAIVNAKTGRSSPMDAFCPEIRPCSISCQSLLVMTRLSDCGCSRNSIKSPVKSRVTTIHRLYDSASDWYWFISRWRGSYFVRTCPIRRLPEQTEGYKDIV